MHPRTTNTLPKTFDVYNLSFESAGALALDNEYSGFAVTPAHYIAFAERKHACPCQVIYHLRRFTWHLYRTSSSRRTSALTGQIPNMTSACKPPATSGENSTASLTRSRALTNGQRRCTGASVVRSRLPSSWRRGRSSLHCRSTTSSRCSRLTRRRSPSTVRRSSRVAPRTIRPTRNWRSISCCAIRSLLSLVEQRRELVGDKTRLTNRLCDTLKQYYPQALEWFEQRDTVLFCDFLTRWPTLLAVRRARKTTLEAFFHAHNCRRAGLIEVRLESIRAATPLTEDPGIVTPCRLHVLALVEQLRTVLTAIDRFDSEIAAVAPCVR